MESKGKFADYLEEAIGKDNAGIALEALSLPASVSVRMNPAKIDAPTPESVSDFFSMPVKPVLWNRYGWFLSERPVFTLDPLMHCGCYYVQDSSAMFVGEVFRQVLKKMSEEGALPKERPLRVLDLCAAPGGKTTDILSSLKMSGIGSYLLVSNEIMKQRAAVLSDNAGIWGDPDVVVTSVDPKAFAHTVLCPYQHLIFRSDIHDFRTKFFGCPCDIPVILIFIECAGGIYKVSVFGQGGPHISQDSTLTG